MSTTGHIVNNRTHCQQQNTVSTTGHSVNNRTQCKQQDTVSTIGHSVNNRTQCQQTGHSANNRTQCPQQDTVSTTGHSVNNRTQCQQQDVFLGVLCLSPLQQKTTAQNLLTQMSRCTHICTALILSVTMETAVST